MEKVYNLSKISHRRECQVALKKDFTEHERYGLTDEEYRLARSYLRKHKTAGAIKDLEAAKLYELFLLGDSFQKLATQFPQYPIGKIILTAALRGWTHDRDKMLSTLQDRVRAKVVKSVLDQVDFLTAMMSVANTEHLESMIKYIQDPISNPKPAMRITNIKEYKEVSENLYKIVAGATTPKPGQNSPMFSALTNSAKDSSQIEDKKAKDDEDINILDVVEGE